MFASASRLSFGLLFVSSLATSVGCVVLGADGETDGENGEANPPTGAWFYAEGDAISDTCMVPNTDVDNSTEFGVTNNGDGTFTVVREGQDIECTISGSDFTCAPLPLDPVPVEGFDATFAFAVTYTGTFDSNTAITGQRDIEVDCEGTACELAATTLMTSFTCNIVDGFTATYG